MSKQSTSMKRSKLYEKVWSTPMSKLAEEFGISDVALGKTCRRHNIPKPGLGYWAKLQHGKKVKKTALPQSKDGDYEITITAFQKPEIQTKDSDPEQITEADQLIRLINTDEKSVPVSDSLDNVHKYVKMAHKSLRNARKDESSILTARIQKCLPIHVSPASLERALFIMDSLLSLLDRYEISLNAEKLNKLNLLGHEISFSLRESFDREVVELTRKQQREKERYSWLHNEPYVKYIPNGKLVLSIDDQCVPSGLRRKWSDTKKQKVEDFLKKFLISAIQVSVHQETMARERERRERERAEEERRRAEISHKRWDEQSRVKQLESEVEQWVKSQQIRSYISHVQDLAIQKYGVIEEGSELSDWVHWATRRADIIDPLVSVETEPWETEERRFYW